MRIKVNPINSVRLDEEKKAALLADAQYRMAKSEQNTVAELQNAAKEIGSVFRNLMNAPPPPPPPPAPPPEHKPVRPSVEVMQAGVEPSVETKVEAVSAGVEPGVKVHDPSGPGKKGSRKPMFTSEDLRRNFVMTEILGKPVALRRK